MKNVLVFPCGSEVGLEIFRSLEFSKDFNLFGASSVDDHGKFVFKNYIGNIPFLNEENFIYEINKIVEKYKIDYIFPAHDSVSLKLSEKYEVIKAEIIGSNLFTNQICRSKKKTYNYFKDVIKIPKLYSQNQNIDYPVFVKPDIGQGSKGAQKVSNEEELKYLTSKDESLLIMEYLPGKEYTVDCFTNKQGKLIFVQGRERRRISNGISVNSIPIPKPEFQFIANTINDLLLFRGAWFFQLKEDFNGNFVLLEIAPRVAGTMGLSRIRGTNLPLLSLYDRMNKDISIIKNSFNVEIDRALYTKYKTDLKYKNVYIDLDDTLLIKNKINITMISYLYFCLNNKIKIYLITRHKHNIENTLKKHKIPTNIFKNIIYISPNQNKFDFIKPNSLLIDDSFSERKQVFEQKGIPVFDLSEVECLIS